VVVSQSALAVVLCAPRELAAGPSILSTLDQANSQGGNLHWFLKGGVIVDSIINTTGVYTGGGRIWLKVEEVVLGLKCPFIGSTSTMPLQYRPC